MTLLKIILSVFKRSEKQPLENLLSELLDLYDEQCINRRHHDAIATASTNGNVPARAVTKTCKMTVLKNEELRKKLLRKSRNVRLKMRSHPRVYTSGNQFIDATLRETTGIIAFCLVEQALTCIVEQKESEKQLSEAAAIV